MCVVSEERKAKRKTIKTKQETSTDEVTTWFKGIQKYSGGGEILLTRSERP
jgi:hypothetical protein